jgi:hypothetical protein
VQGKKFKNPKNKKPTITIVMVRAKKSPVKTGLGEKKGRG